MLYRTIWLATVFIVGACSSNGETDRMRPDGDCVAISARGYRADSGQTCLGEFEKLGCAKEAEVKDRDACVRSRDGAIYGGIPLNQASLLLDAGYETCTAAETEAWNRLDVCE
jgi:hypothetical protein